METCIVAISVLCDDLDEWDGVGGKSNMEEIYVYIYNLVASLYSRNQHIIKQLYSNKKENNSKVFLYSCHEIFLKNI